MQQGSKTTEVQAQPWKAWKEDKMWADLLLKAKMGTAAEPKPGLQAQSKKKLLSGDWVELPKG